MPADHRLSAQINLILKTHPRAVVVPENWGDTGEVDYIYRPEAILTHERDVDRVVRALRQILTDPEQGGLQVPDGEQLPFEREEGPAEREEGPVERRWPVRVSAR